MRVDTPEHGPHDHAFGQGAHPAELQHDVGLGAESHVAGAAAATHGLLDGLETHAAAAALGGHVEIGHFDHDFHSEHGLLGLDGLHDSVHHSVGLGFGGDEHHTLHDSLHHDLHADPQHDVQHDLAHDVQHHDIGHLFH